MTKPTFTVTTRVRLFAVIVAVCGLLATQLPLADRAQAAPGPVVVSLSFDDGLASQYNLAFAATWWTP